MVSYETKIQGVAVVGASLLLALSAAAGVDDVLFGAFLFVGVGFLLPQAFLLRHPSADDEVPRETRLRVTGAVGAFLLWAFSWNAPAPDRAVLAGAAVAVFLAWTLAEGYAGYREGVARSRR